MRSALAPAFKERKKRGTFSPLNFSLIISSKSMRLKSLRASVPAQPSSLARMPMKPTVQRSVSRRKSPITMALVASCRVSVPCPAKTSVETPLYIGIMPLSTSVVYSQFHFL